MNEDLEIQQRKKRLSLDELNKKYQEMYSYNKRLQMIIAREKYKQSRIITEFKDKIQQMVIKLGEAGFSVPWPEEVTQILKQNEESKWTKEGKECLLEELSEDEEQ